MIKVIICDDEQEIRQALQGYLLQYEKTAGLQFEIVACKTGKELLESFDRAGCDLILLDIEMPEGNGMEAARAIRQKSAEPVIIFITNMVQYALEGYEVQAYRFLEKPVEYDRFVKVIDGAVSQILKNDKYVLTVKNADGIARIKAADILYAETFRGHVLIHCVYGDVECFQTMASLEALLEKEGFFRCHSAYLINLSKVEKLKTKDLSLKGDVVIPVSKHRRRQLVETLTDFWGGMLL